MALTPSEKQKAYRARKRAESANPRIDFSGQHGKRVVIDKMVMSATEPRAYPLKLHSVAAPVPVADTDAVDHSALLGLIETLFLDGQIKTMARRRLLDALGA
jgi:hypothetical protein